MITTMLNEVKKFTAPDEVRTFPNGRLELLHFGEHVIAKIVLQPGWRVKTALCESVIVSYSRETFPLGRSSHYMTDPSTAFLAQVTHRLVRRSASCGELPCRVRWELHFRD